MIIYLNQNWSNKTAHARLPHNA